MSVPRRRFLTGLGAAGIPFVVGTGPRVPSPFPDTPDATTTTTQDREQMLWQLGVPVPVLPPRATDPNRPPNVVPRDPANPEGNWADPLGHFVTRSGFGQWITYDDDAGPAGGAVSPFGDYGPTANPRYTDIELLRMRDGTPVRTPEDWWVRRRPEILHLVRDNLYGRIPDRRRWPAIAWSVGPVTTGTANGVAFQERVVTGAIDTSGYPGLRDVPRIEGTLRTPLDMRGRPVPVVITFDPSPSAWQFTAPYNYGVFAYRATALQPDVGGAAMSSFLIGLVNKGRWRHPLDWGALAAWSWGISRVIDHFETDPEVDATRIAVQGHSRFGKATLVAAAYDERIAAAFPSSAGALGTSWARRAWGETLELVCGADTEYHWVAGNIMRYGGELRPGTYWPRRVERLPVDVHCVMALVAPRVVLTNGGTDTPPGFGDAWTDPRGMYLAGAFASPAWHLLGWPGQVIPPGTVFTSGPGESIGGTPPIDVEFIDGTVGWRRHAQGHTPVPDWPSFMRLAGRHLDDNRPAVRPGQRFTLREGQGPVIGTVLADDADGDPLGNWQITGGTGVGLFAIDRATGRLGIADARRLARARRDHATLRFTLRVIVDDRKLTSHPEVVTIECPRRRRG
jgi:hypothetical protein